MTPWGKQLIMTINIVKQPGGWLQNVCYWLEKYRLTA